MNALDKCCQKMPSWLAVVLAAAFGAEMAYTVLGFFDLL